MSDSDDALFNLEDADNSDRDQSDDGTTAYPKHKVQIAGDSDSDSRTYSGHNDPVQIKPTSSRRSSISTTRAQRQKSRKRLSQSFAKQQTVLSNSSTNTTTTVGGEAGADADTFVDIDPSSPNSKSPKSKRSPKSKSRRFLKGKSHRNHHVVSNQDSSDSEDSSELGSPNLNPPTPHRSFTQSIEHVFFTLRNNGDSASMLLSVLSFISLLGCISGSLYAVLVFAIFYAAHLIECAIYQMRRSYTGNALHENEANHVTVKLLDSLRTTPPVIDWTVESYHMQSTLLPPMATRNVLLWIGLQSAEVDAAQTQSLADVGFDVKGKEDVDGVQFVGDAGNLRRTAVIVLPSGYEGARVESLMRERWKVMNLHSAKRTNEFVAVQVGGGVGGADEAVDLMSEDGSSDEVSIQIDDGAEDVHGKAAKTAMTSDDAFPVFVRWSGSMTALLDCLTENGVVREEERKVVTNVSQRVFEYGEWHDESEDYPDFCDTVMFKLNLTKEFVPLNDETRQAYIERKERFLERNNDDEQQSFSERMEIMGFQPSLVIRQRDDVRGEMVPLPFWSGSAGFWLFSVFLCSLYPRFKCATMCGAGSWKIVKAISI